MRDDDLISFKVGFIESCLRSGIDPRDAAEAVRHKVAAQKRAFVGDVVNSSKDLLRAAVPLAIAAPIVAGAVGGYGLSRLTDVSNDDVAAVSDGEVEDTYRQQTDKLKRRKAFLDRRTSRNSGGYHAY